MRAGRSVVLATLGLSTSALALGGCTTTRPFSDFQFGSPEGEYRLIVFQPDVLISVVRIGEAAEVREDWTLQARKHVLNAIVEHERIHGGETTIVAAAEDAGVDPALLSDLLGLHKVVGQAIKLHKYSQDDELPTKRNRFDWTLGDRAVEFGAVTQHDYALFVHARDSHSSEGRAALQVATLLLLPAEDWRGSDIPYPELQTVFASLVDLRTGQVVWFNELQSLSGDIRFEGGARRMVADLLGPMRPNSSRQARTRNPQAT